MDLQVTRALTRVAQVARMATLARVSTKVDLQVTRALNRVGVARKARIATLTRARQARTHQTAAQAQPQLLVIQVEFGSQQLGMMHHLGKVLILGNLHLHVMIAGANGLHPRVTAQCQLCLNLSQLGIQQTQQHHQH